MGELRKRGESADEPKPKKESSGRYGNLGDFKENGINKEDMISQVRRLQGIMYNLVVLYDIVAADPKNAEAMKNYTEALHEVVHMDERDLMTILGSGIGAIAELRKKGL